jgi:hypothetical protein
MANWYIHTHIYTYTHAAIPWNDGSLCMVVSNRTPQPHPKTVQDVPGRGMHSSCAHMYRYISAYVCVHAYYIFIIYIYIYIYIY